jgi:hypothetical protein
MGLFDEAPEAATVLGRPLRCQVCDGETFYKREAQLLHRVNLFVNVQWSSGTCTCLICSSCGYVHWFLPEP